nr:MAG TPA: hypothetical protein [Caudoviricetes sp.]
MDIYEKIKAGEVISDSDFAACDETPLDIFRFFEKELKNARYKATKRLFGKLSLIQEREELKKATMTLAEGLNFQQERADKLAQECEELKKQYNCYACDTCKGKEDYRNLKRHCENAIRALHNKQAELDQLKAKDGE